MSDFKPKFVQPSAHCADFDFDAIDGREPESPYREAASLFIAEVDRILSFLVRAKNKTVAIRSMAFAFGRHHINGADSQTEIANKIGVTKAEISREVKRIQRSFGSTISGIQPMPGQRSPEACSKFKQLRNDKCK